MDLDDMDVDYRPPEAGTSQDDSSSSEAHITALARPRPTLSVEAASQQQLRSEREGKPSPRKRRRSYEARDLLSDPNAPLKRKKTAFNAAYLAFFNNFVFDVNGKQPHEFHPKLASSQLGVINWSAAEKNALFAAVTRLGQDDLPGIAAQVHTKSVLEVRQYLMLLQDAAINRRENQAGRSATVTLADHPAAIEVDQDTCNALDAAADDLSLRQEAHEEGVEEHRWGDTPWLITPAVARDLEHQVKQHDPDIQTFGEFFITRKWLLLSEHIFMNAAIEDCNWQSVGPEKPAIRATALEDFYSLAKSVTRRLLATTLIMANSRLRRRKQTKHGSVKAHDVKAARLSLGMPGDSSKFWATSARRLRLNVYDDESTAVDPDKQFQQEVKRQGTEREGSLHDDGNARDISEWAEQNDSGGSDDDDDDDDDDGDEEDEEEEDYGDNEIGKHHSANIEDEPPEKERSSFLPYDRIEALLGFPGNVDPVGSSDESDSNEEDLEVSEDEASPAEPDEGSQTRDVRGDGEIGSNCDDSSTEASIKPSQPGTRNVMSNPSPSPPPSPPTKPNPCIDSEAVEHDLLEAIHHSTIDFAGTTRAKETLRAKIAAEHRLQAEAEGVDMAASRAEHARLWAMLHEEEVPDELPAAAVGGPAGESAAASRMSSAVPSSDDNEGFATDTATTNNAGGIRRNNRRTATLDGSSVGASGIGGGTNDWRAKTEYYSEWELQHRQRQTS
ncbi:RNA polymerase I-specific transcription initiation factor RRN5 [Microdochium nivale]|nr:RNA polymerase I-specific transcription initiation factor RRN5 [Microdochium nivale]